jgi:hypothetical protein
LLTQIVDPKTRPFDPQSPQISIGGKVPSVDASDPLGGSSGPVYQDNLQISFALLPMDRQTRGGTVIIAQLSGNASDNLLTAMDRESKRVGHELNKQKVVRTSSPMKGYRWQIGASSVALSRVFPQAAKRLKQYGRLAHPIGDQHLEPTSASNAHNEPLLPQRVFCFDTSNAG